MVKKEIISAIFNKILTKGQTFKCHYTIAEMHGMLSESSYEDQYKQLKEKGLLNPLEDKDMLKSIKDLEEYRKKYEEWKDDELLGQMYKEDIERLEDNLFKYGRRLIEGYETEFPVDLEEYKDKVGQRDEQFKLWEEDDFGENELGYDMTHKMGFIEEMTIDEQQKNVRVNDNPEIFVNDKGEADIRETDDRLRSMNNYFAGDTSHINHFISHEGYLNRLKTETRKEIKNIDSLMKESTGLPYNTLLFRGGYFNIHTRVGETISFKGYTSTTFQYETAEWYNGVNTFMYLIHAPKGTKGIAGNDDRFNNGFMEHEYVLPRNTKMKVINIDYEKNICEVVIEE